jgi:hypothetical protein
VSFLQRFVDERFLEHRRRSTSAAGIATAVLALVLFEYRWNVDRIWSWDLLGVALTFIVIKISLMVWYSVKR